MGAAHSTRKTRPPPILDSPIWQNLPTDILELVVDWLIIACQADGKRYTLQSLSRVSRRWRQRILPSLFLHFSPPQSIEGPEVIAQLRMPSNPYRGATQMTLHSVKNLNAGVIAHSSILLPALTQLLIVDHNGSINARSHPSWSKMFGGSFTGFKNLSKLELRNCTFHSSSDVLYMLAMLPSLSDPVSLKEIKWTHTDGAIPHKKYNRLESIYTRETSEWPLLWYWTLPHPKTPSISSEQAGHEYPGFTYMEAQIMTQIACRMIRSSSKGCMKLDRSLYYEETWILRFNKPDRPMDSVEAYITPNAADTRGYIRWIVFRCESLLEIFYESELAEVSRRLTQLPRLEKVVLEVTLGGVDCAEAFPLDLEIDKERLHVWSRKEARLYAEIVKKRGTSANNHWNLPVSTYWLEQFEKEDSVEQPQRANGEENLWFDNGFETPKRQFTPLT